jgi:hypothetical protein
MLKQKGCWIYTKYLIGTLLLLSTCCGIIISIIERITQTSSYNVSLEEILIRSFLAILYGAASFAAGYLLVWQHPNIGFTAEGLYLQRLIFHEFIPFQKIEGYLNINNRFLWINREFLGIKLTPPGTFLQLLYGSWCTNKNHMPLIIVSKKSTGYDDFINTLRDKVQAIELVK